MTADNWQLAELTTHWIIYGMGIEQPGWTKLCRQRTSKRLGNIYINKLHYR